MVSTGSGLRSSERIAILETVPLGVSSGLGSFCRIIDGYGPG